MLKIQRSKEEASGKKTQSTWKESANAKGNPRKMKTDAAAAVMKTADEDAGPEPAAHDSEGYSPCEAAPGFLALSKESAYA